MTGQFNSTVYKNRISTHTLTWSVTLTSPLYHFTALISTHTLTWSVTTGYYEQFCTPYISTHTLTWSVTLYGKSHKYEYDISTHTLTWSVTFITVDILERLYFNSHAHVERDHIFRQ